MRLTTIAMLLTVMLVPVTCALAADSVQSTYPADFDRVWAATEKALGAEGWGIDHAARPLGLFVTKSQRLAGSDIGVLSKNQRLRLRLTLTPDGKARTQVRVEREVFRRERVLWTDRDEHVPIADGLADRAVEERVLAAIARQL